MNPITRKHIHCAVHVGCVHKWYPKTVQFLAESDPLKRKNREIGFHTIHALFDSRVLAGEYRWRGVTKTMHRIPDRKTHF